MPNNFSVLIVEDDDDARTNLEDILSLDGYNILAVPSCLPAIHAIENHVLDAVIVDWRLPDGDGGELISIVSETQPNTPVIVVTGVRDFETPVEALRSGAYDFLTKPINPDVLRSTLGRLVERKRHLVEIEEAQTKLVNNERLAAIGQMVAGLAHESRNAFQRSHACLAELSLDLQEMPDSLKLVYKVQKALDDIHRLLEEVREYSAPINLEIRDTNVESMIDDAWNQILDARQLDSLPELIIQRSDTFPKTVRLDPHRMGQVLRNLLENAIFACPEDGKIEVLLDFSTSVKSTKRVRVEISDNGDGVPEENREEVFTPFFTTKTKGTGLGLAICRRIVASHQGRIFVDESPSKGARFIIELPFER